MGLVGIFRKNKMKKPSCQKLACQCKLVWRYKHGYAWVLTNCEQVSHASHTRHWQKKGRTSKNCKFTD